MHVKDTHRTFHPTIAEYIFFLSVHRTFSRIDHVRPQNKSQHSQQDKTYLIPFPATMVYETKNQYQEESWKTQKYTALNNIF